MADTWGDHGSEVDYAAFTPIKEERDGFTALASDDTGSSISDIDPTFSWISDVDEELRDELRPLQTPPQPAAVAAPEPEKEWQAECFRVLSTLFFNVLHARQLVCTMPPRWKTLFQRIAGIGTAVAALCVPLLLSMATYPPAKAEPWTINAVVHVGAQMVNTTTELSTWFTPLPTMGLDTYSYDIFCSFVPGNTFSNPEQLAYQLSTQREHVRKIDKDVRAINGRLRSSVYTLEGAFRAFGKRLAHLQKRSGSRWLPGGISTSNRILTDAEQVELLDFIGDALNKHREEMLQVRLAMQPVREHAQLAASVAPTFEGDFRREITRLESELEGMGAFKRWHQQQRIEFMRRDSGKAQECEAALANVGRSLALMEQNAERTADRIQTYVVRLLSKPPGLKSYRLTVFKEVHDTARYQHTAMRVEDELSSYWETFERYAFTISTVFPAGTPGV